MTTICNPGGLYQSPDIYNRRKTLLAFEAAYYPDYHIRTSHKVVWSRKLVRVKASVLANCNEDRTHYFHGDSPKPFKIHWEYNNIPTATEWGSWDELKLIQIDLRISPLIEEPGRIALLSLAPLKRNLIRLT